MPTTAEEFLLAGSCLAAPFVLPTLAYLGVLRRARLAWPSVTEYAPVAVTIAAAGPYRGPARPLFAPRDVRGAGGPPDVVRAAAFASYFLGQMFVPGLLAGLVGVYFCGLGLISIPGLFLAAKCISLGTELLQREPGVAWRADRTARFAYVLNGVVATVGFGFLLASLPFGFFLVAYALVSVGHGVLLQKAAAAIRAVTPLDP